MKFNLINVAFALIIFSFISCNKEEKVYTKGKGKINVQITDAPFPIELVSSAIITVDRVEIRGSQDNETADDSITFNIINDEEMEIDLLDLTNGVTEQIAFADLEPGMYDMIRLHVTKAMIVLNDGTEFDLKVPSGTTSGLKVKLDPEIYLEADQTTDVLLDFDVSRSFVAQGSWKHGINGFIFKPVVRGVYLGAAGRIEGNVTDTANVVMENVMVKTWTTEDDDIEEDHYLASTFTDEYGNYKLVGLPEGSYSVAFISDDFGNDTINGVNVTSGNTTELDFGF